MPGLGEQTGEAETSVHAVILSETLAGFVTMWDGRNGNLDYEVDRAQAALVTSLGGTEVCIRRYRRANGFE